MGIIIIIAALGAGFFATVLGLFVSLVAHLMVKGLDSSRSERWQRWRRGALIGGLAWVAYLVFFRLASPELAHTGAPTQESLSVFIAFVMRIFALPGVVLVGGGFGIASLRLPGR